MEPVPVQLTRMEGTLNLVAYQILEVKKDIEGVRVDHESTKIRLSLVETSQAAAAGAFTSWRSWLPVIISGLGVVAALGLGVTFGK